MNDDNVLRHVTKDITNEAVTEYLTNFYKPLTPKLGEFRSVCEAEPFPVILRETEDFLSTFMDVTKPLKVLEIGTAVGYSAMFFAEKIGRYDDLIRPRVYTVEKDEEMYRRACLEIERMGYSDYIRCFSGDCEEGIKQMEETDFDLVFIDAAKSHYKRFLEACLKVLSRSGVIICDDTLFQGRPALEEELPPRKHRTNTLALRDFNESVKNDPRLSSTHIAVGNGLTIIKPIDR